MEREKLLGKLAQLSYSLVIPPAVKAEIEVGSKSILSLVSVVQLKGRSLKKAASFKKLGIDTGEAECCALTEKLKLGMIVCDDQKFMRQRFMSSNKNLKEVKVVGFSFLLYLFHKSGGINDVWAFFRKIIASNNWERNSVQASNRRFLQDMGFI